MIINLKDQTPKVSRRTIWLTLTALTLAIPLAIIWWPGWRQYPAVTSPESLQTMKLLYAACNTKDSARLKQVEARVEKLIREDKMSAPEHKAFAKILALANAGDWGRAEKAAFKFAQDQVGVGHPASNAHHHDHSASRGKHSH